MYTKIAVLAAIVASASAFAPKPAFKADTALFVVDPNPKPNSDAQALEMGWSMGGEAHTRNPTPVVSDDPRLTIPQGESFEEYMKSRGMGGAAPAPAPAPVAAPAPAAPATGGWTPPASWGAPAPAPAPVAAPAAAAPSQWATPAVDPNPKPMDGSQALEMGWSMGGEAHTRNPTPVVSDDPRLTIPQGESFEEYMKARGM